MGGTIQGDDRELPPQLHQPGHRAVVQHREGEDLPVHQRQPQPSRQSRGLARTGESSGETAEGGPLGSFRETGNLVISGRVNDMII